MPQANRDQERLYPPGRLSVWFLFASVALVVSLGWMIWADHFQRPWKAIQADYYRRQAGLLEIDRQRKEATVLGVGARDDEERAARERVAALEARVAAADRRLEEPDARGERTRLEKDLAEAKAAVDDADRAIKNTKGDYAEYRYRWQDAKTRGAQAEMTSWKGRLDVVATDQQAAESRRAEHAAKAKALQARLDDLLSERKAAAVALTDARKDYASVTRQLDDAVGKTDRAAWRNWPILDFVKPSIRIDKVVLENVHDDFVFATSPKVDMCMTCHRGIDQAIVSESTVRDLLVDWIRLKVGEKAWGSAKVVFEGPERREASLSDVFPDAEMEVDPSARSVPGARAPPLARRRDWSAAPSPWGAGEFRPWLQSGRAEMADLLPRATWESLLGTKDLTEGFRRVFGTADPLSAFRVKPVEWAHPHLEAMVGSKSPHKMDKTGCTVCHAGVGQSTDFTRAAHVPPESPVEAAREAKRVEERLAEVRRRLSDLSREAKVDPAETAPLRSEETSLLRRLDVLTTDERWEREHGWKEPEYVDFPMVPMRYVEGQCLKCHLPSLHVPPKPEPLAAWDWKRNPKDGTWDRVRALAPNPVAGKASDVDGRWHPETLERGLDTIRDFGCTGCHTIKNLFVTPGLPRATGTDPGRDFTTPAPGTLTTQGFRKVGPDLTHVADKTDPGFVYRWVMNPNSFRIDTRMPSFYRRREHDESYQPVVGPDGKPDDRWIVPEHDARDEARMEVEALSITKYLFAAVKGSRKDSYAEPPAGDPKRGAKVFYSVGCYGCHVSNGVWDETANGWSGDAAARKVQPTGLLPGPRLTAMGSKTNAKWLNAWLVEPRHYWSMANMGNMRWKDTEEAMPDGTKVKRSAGQVRADVVAYLLAFRDEAFERMPTPEDTWSREHVRALDDYWMEFYGAGQADSPLQNPASIEAAQDFAATRVRDDKLVEVGKKLVGQRGCFGCHAIAGYEDATQIGKELTSEGRQDIHKFDFALLAGTEVPETRWDWIDTKIRDPRVYDRGTYKPKWQDRLRMPKFNFLAKDREGVVAVILGLVRDVKDPSKADAEVKELALYRPSPAARDIEAGRAVVARYRCNQCHSIEGRLGYVTQDQRERGVEAWMLPPSLHGEGNRVKAEWLFRFLKDPDDPEAAPDGFIRPSVIQRMPKFRMTDEEASALVDYFERLAGRADRTATDLDDQPLSDAPYAEPIPLSVEAKDPEGKPVKHEFAVKSLREETKALFDTANCNRCHLPKGTPGADPNEGASAPPFTLAGRRLRREWVRDMIEDPLRQIPNTKMPAFWSRKRGGKPGDTRKLDFPQFVLTARSIPSHVPDDVSSAQMDALARFVLHHYEPTKFPAAAPPPDAAPPAGGR